MSFKRMMGSATQYAWANLGEGKMNAVGKRMLSDAKQKGMAKLH
jgi:hypothetical protein